ncbi:MAG: Maf family protein [Lachnospiraceae bacterium]
MKKLILASASPRRSELLEMLGLSFEVVPSHFEEYKVRDNLKSHVQKLALGKALAVAESYHEDEVILGADTLVTYRNRILGKPETPKEAKKMLTMLQGNTHRVYTGVALVLKNYEAGHIVRTFYESTDVTFYPMSQTEIDLYIASQEPMDKAGAYDIRRRFSVNIEKIHGDYNTVVGLPIARLHKELRRLQVDILEGGYV